MRHFFPLAALITVSCAGAPKYESAATDQRPVLAKRCVTSTPWTPGTAAFADRSVRSGLADLDAQGIRIASADLDGDGYADLVIRRAGGDGDDPSGKRTVWLLRNRGDGTFEDSTQTSGLVTPRVASGSAGRPAEVVAIADVDNDGDLDVFTGFSQDGGKLDGSEIMLNNGNGRFELGSVTQPFRHAAEAASVSGASFIDANRDGLVDLWIGRGRVGRQPVHDTLYVQGRDGEFVDVSADVGLVTAKWDTDELNAGRAHTNAWSVAACDLDGDGTTELLASSYGRGPNHLWQGSLSKTALSFRNHSVASGYAYDHRTDWHDNESARCYCKLHREAPDCADVPLPRVLECEQPSHAFRWNHATDREPYRLGGNSGTTVCADVDTDGDLDLLTTEIVHWDVGSSADPSELLFNRGDSPPTFERPGNEVTGLKRPHPPQRWDDGDITAAVFDFDNDGRPDVYIGSTDYPGARGWLYHQLPDGRFEPVPLSDGIDHTRSHGLAVADYDRDGDLDLVVGHSKFRCNRGNDCYESGHARYFENVVGQNGNWVQLSLEGGAGSNRAAIGARVTVEANGRTAVQEVGGGHGHYGVQHDLTLHFGLGSACTAKVSVRWPDAKLSTQTFELQAGYRYALSQGGQPRAVGDRS